MTSATVFQSEDVATLAARGRVADQLGADLRGATATRRLYEASDGWIAICALTAEHETGLRDALGLDELTPHGIAGAVRASPAAQTCDRLRAHGVPAAISVHPSAVPGDAQVRHRGLLTELRHPVAGRVVQVGIPLRLSVDVPAVKGAAPAPLGRRRAYPKTT